MRTLALILLTLTIFACKATENKAETSKQPFNQPIQPDYTIAIQFINDYLDYTNDMKSEIGLIEWIYNRTDITTGFKIELKSLLDEAAKNNPNVGLGFDPILDAQDSPSQFELDKTDSEFLTVKGKDWPDFQLTLKVKLVANKWLVDGAGIINVPENKRIMR